MENMEKTELKEEEEIEEKDELGTNENDNMPTFEIVQLNMLGTYEYNVLTTICTICKNPLSFSSPDNEEINKIFKYNVSLGNCGHPYHTNCIEQWLKSSKTCPTCFSEFTFSLKSLDDPYWNTSLGKK